MHLKSGTWYLINSSPTISVIIPTFNRCNLLGRAINSILAQSMSVEEIIVVDNGSTDGTRDMLRSSFPMVRCVDEHKPGVSAARNCGLSVAIGDWIAFLDSDDAWLPKKLEKQMAVYSENSNLRLIHTNEIWYRRGKRVNQMKKHKKRGGNIFKHCLPICCISPSSVLLRKDLIQYVGLFDEELPACEDYDMWLRVTAREPVLYIDEALTVKYGGHSDQLSKKFWGMDRFRVQSLEKLLARKILTNTQIEATHRVLLKKLNILIKGGLKRGNSEVVDFYSEKLAYWIGAEILDDAYAKKALL